MTAKVTRIRPKATSLAQAVQGAVNATQTTPADAGAVQLAHQYAEAIDADPTQLKTLGPMLLAALAELGLTPKARSALLKGAPDGRTKPSALSGLRDRATARADRAAPVDPTAP